MKRFIASILCILLLAALLCGCDVLDPSLSADPETPSDVETGDGIVSITLREDVDLAAVEEFFWSDEEFWYVFPSEMSEAIIVTYADGTTQPLIEALESGRVTVEDLEAYALPYRKEAVDCDIVAIRLEIEGAEVSDELACIIEDETAWYMMGGERDYYVVEYASGAVEPLYRAIVCGRVTVAELDRFGIVYQVIPRDAEVASITFTGAEGEESAELIYCTGEGRTLWSLKGGDGKLLFAVEYTTGGVEPLASALNGGRVTVEDLDRFGVPYTQMALKEYTAEIGGGSGGASDVNYAYANGTGGQIFAGDGEYFVTVVDPDKMQALFPTEK